MVESTKRITDFGCKGKEFSIDLMQDFYKSSIRQHTTGYVESLGGDVTCVL